jgi:hypothetical protein
MGIISKTRKSQKPDSRLEKEELEFVLLKLREANYTGHEFEMFYKVWVKLAGYLKSIE